MFNRLIKSIICSFFSCIELAGRLHHLLGIACEELNILEEAEEYMTRAAQIFLAEPKFFYHVKALREKFRPTKSKSGRKTSSLPVFSVHQLPRNTRCMIDPVQRLIEVESVLVSSVSIGRFADFYFEAKKKGCPLSIFILLGHPLKFSYDLSNCSRRSSISFNFSKT
jgi:hypothetical protein